MNPRTCVGCRKPVSAAELIRLALDHTSTIPTVVVDQRRRLAGRGAHVHPVDQCIDAALRRHALPRALRVSSALDVTAVMTLRK
ncbi:MAG: YlxR family protein [Antricoccus sp.]